MPKPETCAMCAAPMLSVLYYGAGDEPIGGHYICSNCGPRSVVEMRLPDEVQRKLLERKAS